MSQEDLKPQAKSSSESLGNQIDVHDISDAEKTAKCSYLAQELGLDEKKLNWKIDLWVVPAFCLLYFLSFLDRVNISNARLYGLSEDLGLTGNQFNVALTIFFVPYIFFELASNYMIKIISPHIWLSCSILLFGGISIGMGFAKNYGQLLACRFLIGMTEASTFPAIFYILSCYYTVKQAQKRYSIFFSSTCLAGGASGAIAYKIFDIDGVHGIAAWRWIFIVEGSFTAGLAILLYFILPDFPEQAKFLNDNERQYLKTKLEIWSGAKSGFEKSVPVKKFLEGLKDPLIWVTALAYFGFIIPAYGYAYFSPTIIASMNFNGGPVRANQLSIAPWLVAFAISISLAILSDYYKRRYPFVVGCIILSIVGLAMVLGSKVAGVRYAGCFLATSGLYTAMPILVCWTSVNTAGHTRKSIGIATQIGFGNIGGIISTFIFLVTDAPVFRKGLAVCISSCCFALLMSSLYLFMCYRSNQAKKLEKYIAEFESLSEEDKVHAGDKNPRFVYLY